jgi:hypothetical protein
VSGAIVKCNKESELRRKNLGLRLVVISHTHEGIDERESHRKEGDSQYGTFRALKRDDENNKNYFPPLKAPRIRMMCSVAVLTLEKEREREGKSVFPYKMMNIIIPNIII